MDDIYKNIEEYNPDKKHFKRFNGFDNSFSFFKKVRDGNITLGKAKKNQNKYKQDLVEIKRSKNKANESNEPKIHYAILKCFKKHETSVIK